MGSILRALTPKTTGGAILRFAIFVGLIVLANFAFAILYDGRLMQDPAYYISHAVVVGGPFTAFFFLVMMMQVRLQRKLLFLSRKDSLTGLDNRRSFLERTARRHRAGGGMLLLIDADNFKKINDTYGHQTGDECLKSIAYMLQRNTRADDVVGRVGGEEFAVFLSGANLYQARVIGKRLTQPIPIKAGPQRQHLTVTLSIGAVHACPKAPLETLLNNADRALYQAKAEGRARMIVWEESDPRITHPAEAARPS